MKIVIVGGGPRGLSVLERIVEWSREEQVIQITMFDPYGPGGKIWRPNQSLLLKMNTVTCQVTLFTDETLSTKGPVTKGPNLYEWTQAYAADFITETILENQQAFLTECANLGPDDYCTRALYGLYQKWFYTYVQSRMTEQTSVTFFKDTVRAVKMDEEKFQVYTQAVEITADKVVLALGHYENELLEEEQKLADYASEHRLFYSPPKNAADAYLEAIKPQSNVIIKGLGLTFFDFVSLLTLGRGGYFERADQQLTYHPSGQEPKIIAGSRNGFPYHGKGKNQKSYGEEHQPHFLKQKRMNKWRRKGFFSAERFFELIKREVEFVYYTTLIQEEYTRIDLEKFKKEFIKSKDSTIVLTKYQIKEEQIWDWTAIQQPDRKRKNEESFQTFMLNYLQQDYREAKKGNIAGPVSSALDCLKDLRDEIRFMLDNELFSNEECQKWLWNWFTPLNAFLSIGPPLDRVEELEALIRAGIIQLTEPGMEVKMKKGQFAVYSGNQLAPLATAHFLIEARLPKTDVSNSQNPLIQQLLRDDLAKAHHVLLADGTEFVTGGIMVNHYTNQLVNKEEVPYTSLFCYGIPTEGVHWLTAVTARPGTDPWNIREADRIAQLIFE